jgi:hypothetical protein
MGLFALPFASHVPFRLRSHNPSCCSFAFLFQRAPKGIRLILTFSIHTYIYSEHDSADGFAVVSRGFAGFREVSRDFTSSRTQAQVSRGFAGFCEVSRWFIRGVSRAFALVLRWFCGGFALVSRGFARFGLSSTAWYRDTRGFARVSHCFHGVSRVILYGVTHRPAINTYCIVVFSI